MAKYTPLNIYAFLLSIHPSISFWLHDEAIVRNATVNLEGQESLCHDDSDPFRSIPRSGKAGLYGSFLFSFFF